MKVMTIGASPFLLVRNGKMNADAIKAIHAAGHEVVSAVWHHDEGYFLPDEGGMHHFEDDEGNNICQLYPFLPTQQNSEVLLYEIMKKVSPDVLISIGDYKEVDFVYAIKAMYPNLFKWIAVFPIDCKYVNENRRERIEYADYVISTTEFGWENLSKLCNVEGEFLPYGPDHSVFSNIETNPNDEPIFLCAAKNAQASNLGAFIKGMGLAAEKGVKAHGRIHTNIYDPGDYDLDLLIDRYGASNIELPEYFCSIKDSIPDWELAEVYSRSNFIIETSVKSATALSMLEAMATGTVPIAPLAGRAGEIISMMPEDLRFTLPFETFVAAHEEEYCVVSPEGISERVDALTRVFYSDQDRYTEAVKAASEIALKFSQIAFQERLSKILDTVIGADSSIAVETFEI